MSMIETAELRSELTLRLRNSRLVDIADLGRSFQALGEEYEAFVVERGFDPIPSNARLFVEKLETGSIVATLRTMLDQASFIIDHLDVLSGFVANIDDLVRYFLRPDLSKRPDISNDTAKNVANILEPVARDSGAQLTIAVTNNSAPVTIAPIIINSEQAKAVQNEVRRFLGPSIPAEGKFEHELLYLQQIRGDTKSKVGDRGVIERFSSKPVKLHFMTPQVKATILDQPENPFKMAYVVDGQVSTIKGMPALYKVSAVHDTIDRS